ncbi:MAG: sigma factor-like helix-turn-helix DNA-binding protein [Thermodesulfobacteriota bacterium]
MSSQNKHSADLPNLETSLEDCFFGNRFDKLVLKIENSLENQEVEFSPPKTISDFLSLEEDDLLGLRGVGKEYLSLWKDLKSLYGISMESHSADYLPSLETSLEGCYFGSGFDRFNKLVLKIRNSLENQEVDFSPTDTLSDLLSLEEPQLLDLRSVGKEYLVLWKDLKSLYGLSTETHSSVVDFISDLSLSYKKLNYAKLSGREKKQLRKLSRHKGDHATLLDIIRFRQKDFIELNGFGSTFVDTILELQHKLLNELERNLYDLDPANNLILCWNTEKLSLKTLEKILLQDIDNFLGSLDERDVDIFQKRWGFVEKQIGLQTLGYEYGLTRERVRQIEKNISGQFMTILSVTPSQINEIISREFNFQLPYLMEDLFSCFDKEKNFYKFLSYISYNKDIQNKFNFKISSDLSTTFFAQNGLSCKYDELICYLEDEDSISGVSGEEVVQYLQETNKVQVEGGNVSPISLNNKSLLESVLAEHPKGLPWLDIVRLANKSGFLKTKQLSESRIPAMLGNSPLVYLSGKGSYRHIKFIDFEDIDIDEIFRQISTSLSKSQKGFSHIVTIREHSSLLQSCDYYLLRYIVRTHCKNYGFSFGGKSQKDIVGLDSDFSGVTQSEAILQAMRENTIPMTTAEVAGKIKSKSISHASLYLHNLIKQKKVVKVDRMLYTLPGLAYKSIDVEEYIDCIKDVLLQESKPVSSSMLQKEVNKRLDVAYSKYFYESIAKKYSDRIGLYWEGMLYSLEEIPYKNLTHAINTHCSPKLDIKSNIQILKQHIVIDEQTAHAPIKRFLLFSY